MYVLCCKVTTIYYQPFKISQYETKIFIAGDLLLGFAVAKANNGPGPILKMEKKMT